MKDLFDPFGRCEPEPVWAAYRPANARHAPVPGYILAPHANTTGSVGGVGSPQGGMQGWDAAVNTQPIPMSNAGTTAAGVAGVAYSQAGFDSGAFSKVVTALVLRNLVDFLRTQPVILQQDVFVRARNIAGTNKMVVSGFTDLSPAQTLLEGIPPETEKLLFDSFEFGAVQKGKVVAITDLAALLSPYDLYSQAAEKVAFNAIDTAEKDAAAILAAGGLAITATGATAAERVVDVVTKMKVAEVPYFGDQTYHALINPVDSAAIMTATGELGWTDAMKYAGAQQLLNGEIGKFRGVRFIETNRVAAGATVVFGPQALAWGDWQTISTYRVAPGGDHADPLAQRGLVGWKGMWGLAAMAFDGTPPMGPATNITGHRFTKVDLTP